MSEINIILGLKKNEACNSIQKMFTEQLSSCLTNHTIGAISTTYKRDEFDQAVASKKYQAAFILEKFDGDAIGQGAIKAWRKADPEINIILVMDISRKATAKAKGLFDLNYYNGLFFDDISRKSIVKLLEKGRVKEEAYTYYQLEKFIDYKKQAQNNAEKIEPKKEVIEEVIKEKESDLETIIEKETIVEASSVTVDPEAISVGDIDLSDYSRRYSSKKDTLSNFSFEVGPEDINDEKDSANSLLMEVARISDEDSINNVTEIVTETKPMIEESVSDLNMEDPVKTEDKQEEKMSVQVEEESEVISTENEETENTNNEEEFDEEVFGSNSEKRTFTDTSGNYEKREVEKKEIYQKQDILESQKIDNIFNSSDSVKKYLESRTEEVYEDHKKQLKMSDSDILFMDCYELFSKQYSVAFDEIASGKSDIGTFESTLFPFVEELQASLQDKNDVMDQFDRFVLGYDILEDLINDEEISEIHVVSYNSVRVKKKGKRFDTTYSFFSRERYRRFCRNLLLRNREYTYSSGIKKEYTDATYSDKYMLHVSITSELLNSEKLPEITIRKSLKDKMKVMDLVKQRNLSSEDAAYIIHSVRSSKGVIVCGPAGGGKTTVLNAAIDYIPNAKNGSIVQYRNEISSTNHPEITIQNPIVASESNQEVTVRDIIYNISLSDMNYLIVGDIRSTEYDVIYEAIIKGISLLGCITCLRAEESINKLAERLSKILNKSIEDIMEVLVERIGTVIFVDNIKVKKIFNVSGYDKEKGIVLQDVRRIYATKKN